MTPDLTPPPLDPGSVVITPAMQYAELRANTDAIRELAAKIDPALLGLQKDVDDNAKGLAQERSEREADIEKLRTDVASLNTWRSGLVGALVLLSALVGWGAINFIRLGGG